MPRGKRSTSAEGSADAAEPRRRSSRLAATAAASPEKAAPETAAEPSPKKARVSPAKRTTAAAERKGSKSEEKDAIVSGDGEDTMETDQPDGELHNKAEADEKHEVRAEAPSGDKEKPEEDEKESHRQDKTDATPANSEEEKNVKDKAEHEGEKNDDKEKQKEEASEAAVAEKKLTEVETVAVSSNVADEERHQENSAAEATDKAAANGSVEADSCAEKEPVAAAPAAASPTKAALSAAVCVANGDEDQANHGGVNGNGKQHSNGEEKAAAPAATEAAC